MGLNIQKGQMYGFVSHTWNVIKGICPHDCSYCYMKVYKQNPMRFDEKELKTDLGSNNFIFVGSSCDMFANNGVKREWILKVLEVCRNYPKNTYLFQSKNPYRFVEFLKYFPKNMILGTTIETTEVGYSNAPSPSKRMCAMESVELFKVDKMVTIEPIIDFNLQTMVDWIKRINPKWVNIGADSKGHNLPEPSKEKIEDLIKELEKFTEVKIKDNLRRLR